MRHTQAGLSPTLLPETPARPGESMRASPLHLALRDATRESHHVIDHHPLMAPLVRSDLSLAEYLRALRALHWIHVAMQKELAAAVATMGNGFVLADRVDWLRADLESLGAEAVPAPVDWRAPELTSAAELIGALYVIEGSTLGGQVIARRIENSLGLGVTSGLRFFIGWGKETERRWQEFWRFADAACGPAHDIAAASAVRLFDALRHGFDLATNMPETATL